MTSPHLFGPVWNILYGTVLTDYCAANFPPKMNGKFSVYERKESWQESADLCFSIGSGFNLKLKSPQPALLYDPITTDPSGKCHEGAVPIPVWQEGMRQS